MNPQFTILSITPSPLGERRCLERIRYRWNESEDEALVQPRDSDTWVVYFHSYGGTAMEILNSPLIYPLWINAIESMSLGLVSFETDGNSFMAPHVVEGVHHTLAFIRERYGAKRFLFIGASMGGSGVLIYAIRYPDDVLGAVALCPVSNLQQHYREGMLHPDLNYFMKNWPVKRFYGESIHAQNEAFAQHSVQKHANRLAMPLAIAHGTADSLISVAQSDHLAELLHHKHDFTYFRYSGEDHAFPSDQGFRDAWPWILRKTGILQDSACGMRHHDASNVLKMKPAHRRKGFSIVELTVTVILVALLTAFLLPALRHVTKKSRSAKCGANLRQLGVAVQLYIGEYGYHSGALANEASIYWYQALNGYLVKSGAAPGSSLSPVFWCPDRERTDGALLSYGYNYMGFGYSPTSVGGGTLPSEQLPPLYWKVRPARVVNPQKRLVLGDSMDLGSAGASAAFLLYKSSDYQAKRHHGGGNYLWADGHVSWATPSDLTAANAKGSEETPWYPF